MELDVYQLSSYLPLQICKKKKNNQAFLNPSFFDIAVSSTPIFLVSAKRSKAKGCKQYPLVGRHIPFSMSNPLGLMAEQGWNIRNAASTGKKMIITILL